MMEELPLFETLFAYCGKERNIGRNHLVSQFANKPTFYLVNQSLPISRELCFIYLVKTKLLLRAVFPDDYRPNALAPYEKFCLAH